MFEKIHLLSAPNRAKTNTLPETNMAPETLGLEDLAGASGVYDLFIQYHEGLGLLED